jgi:hypothetical protein
VRDLKAGDGEEDVGFFATRLALTDYYLPDYYLRGQLALQ